MQRDVPVSEVDPKDDHRICVSFQKDGHKASLRYRFCEVRSTARSAHDPYEKAILLSNLLAADKYATQSLLHVYIHVALIAQRKGCQVLLDREDFQHLFNVPKTHGGQGFARTILRNYGYHVELTYPGNMACNWCDRSGTSLGRFASSTLSDLIHLDLKSLLPQYLSLPRPHNDGYSLGFVPPEIMAFPIFKLQLARISTKPSTASSMCIDEVEIHLPKTSGLAHEHVLYTALNLLLASIASQLNPSRLYVSNKAYKSLSSILSKLADSSYTLSEQPSGRRRIIRSGQSNLDARLYRLELRPRQKRQALCAVM